MESMLSGSTFGKMSIGLLINIFMAFSVILDKEVQGILFLLALSLALSFGFQDMDIGQWTIFLYCRAVDYLIQYLYLFQDMYNVPPAVG